MRNFDDRIENLGATAAGRLSAEEDNCRFKELENAISTLGISLDPQAGPDTDFTMLAQAMSRASSLGVFGNCTGSANTYVVTATVGVIVPKALFAGMRVRTRPSATNTSTSTLNAFGLGVKQVRNWSGAVLVGGELVSARDVELEYDPSLNSAAGAWRIVPWSQPPDVEPGIHFRLTQGSTSIPNNVFTTVTSYTGVGSTLLDSTVASGVVTIGSRDAGKWLILGGMVAGITNVTQVRSDILVNAAANGGHFQIAGASTFSVLSTHGPNIIDLVAGDTIGLRLFQVNSGASSATLPGYLLGTRIGR